MDELDLVEQTLSPPDVFDLESTALREHVSDRRDLLTEIADRSVGELRRSLQERLEWQAAFDEAMLDGWETDRVALAEARGDGSGWLFGAVGREVRREDGESISSSRFVYDTRITHQRLLIGCHAPELAGGPAQETTEDPPPGRLVYFRPDGRWEDDGDGALFTSDTTGENERTLPSPHDWAGQMGGLDVASSGDSLLVSARRGEEFVLEVITATGDLVDSVRRAPDQLACPSWSPAGDRLVATTNTADTQERRLHLLDPTGTAPAAPLQLPFASVGCGDFITDQRLVVDDAARDPDGDHGVWTVGIDGSDPQLLHSTGDCGSLLGGLDPAGTRVALSLNCSDSLSSGVWIVDLADGEATHVVTGLVAMPKWSPDGNWLVFGFIPLGERATIGVWMAQADGRQLRQVAEDASFPVWLPPA